MRLWHLALRAHTPAQAVELVEPRPFTAVCRYLVSSEMQFRTKHHHELSIGSSPSPGARW
jgi:hypothetical protein